VAEAVKAVPVVLAETAVQVVLAVAESIHKVQTMELEVPYITVQDGITVLIAIDVQVVLTDFVQQK
jgi:hypothetical protein